MKIIYYYNCR